MQCKHIAVPPLAGELTKLCIWYENELGGVNWVLFILGGLICMTLSNKTTIKTIVNDVLLYTIRPYKG